MALLGKTEKQDKTWDLHATVLEKFSGQGSNGEPYFRVKIGGFTFFSRELYFSVEEGDKVVLSGEYTGDRYNRKNQTYQPQFELTACSPLPGIDVHGAFSDVGSIPRINGNGAKLDKGAPA